MALFVQAEFPVEKVFYLVKTLAAREEYAIRRNQS
jgi:hypothetical protein